MLLEALPAVCQVVPGFRLVCQREGSLRPELERQACELGLKDSVRFVGYQSNVPE